MPDILSGLILVQTVCKGYQQMTLVVNEDNSSKVDEIIANRRIPIKLKDYKLGKHTHS